ncbi:MAG TPA: hypothetical protein VGB38_00880 [bacterium]
MSKKRIIDRYAVLEDGSVAIDVSVPGIEDLYDDFDRAAPFLKKDLDPQFADYLVDCATEIGRRKFSIRIDLERMPDEARMERVKKSIANYFDYMLELEQRRLKKMAQTSLFLLAGGLVLLLLDIWVNRLAKDSTSVLAIVFSEGLTIAAWVAIWEALANLLIQWTPHRHSLRLYRRLSSAPILFREVLKPLSAG